MNRSKKSIDQRLLKKITKGKTVNDCWEWHGGTNNIGYPFIRYDGKMQLAHRVMAHINGITGVEIQHTCGNYKCLNPRHLKGGTMRTRIDRCIENGHYERLANKMNKQVRDPSKFWKHCEYCDKDYYANQLRFHEHCKAQHELLAKYAGKHK